MDQVTDCRGESLQVIAPSQTHAGMNPKAEQIRKQYRYRRLILTGKIALAQKTAACLIGPDCAYHLYSQKKSKRSKGKP